MLLYAALLVLLLRLVELTYGYDANYSGYHVGVEKSGERDKDHYKHRDITRQKLVLTAYNENLYPTDFFEVNCTVPICEGPLAEIYCTGPILFAAWYFGFQSTCPGTRLLESPEEVVKNYERLGKPVKVDDFKKFCDANFDMAPYLRDAVLDDWVKEPKHFSEITDHKMRSFADRLNDLWHPLAKEFIPDVQDNSTRYPILSVPNRFIVPGGHFEVYFYWDTYWILKGLLFSDLYETARGMLENFAHIISLRGYIPNSGDIQLSRRSQPPLFTQMVADWWDAVGGSRSFLEEFLPVADAELAWWDASRQVNVTIEGELSNETRDVGQRTSAHTLYQYRAVTNCPRPENFLEDYQNGIQSAGHDPEFVWSSTASACESGLDFTTRWFGDSADASMSRKSIRTNRLVPVDLNVFMVRNFDAMARLYGEEMGEQKKAAAYRKKATQLREAIDAVLKDREAGSNTFELWFDYDLETKQLRRQFYPSNVYPLMLLLGDGAAKNASCQRAVAYLKASGALNYAGGMPSSLMRDSKEQWDFPNGWAPIQDLVVEALESCPQEEAHKAAKRIADAFLNTSYNGLFNPLKGYPAQMWEKYDVRYSDGRSGFGGEYPVQAGFGWTNGVVLDFIRRYYTNRSARRRREKGLPVPPVSLRLASMDAPAAHAVDAATGPSSKAPPSQFLPTLFVAVAFMFCMGMSIGFLYYHFMMAKRRSTISGRFWALEEGVGGALTPNPFSQPNSSRQESEQRLLLNTRCSKGGANDSDDSDSSGSELNFKTTRR